MIEIALFDPRDYDEVMGLWSETEGLTLGRRGYLQHLAVAPSHRGDDIILMSRADADAPNA